MKLKRIEAFNSLSYETLTNIPFSDAVNGSIERYEASGWEVEDIKIEWPKGILIVVIIFTKEGETDE